MLWDEMGEPTPDPREHYPAALPTLRGQLTDERHEVRAAARRAIEQIEGGLS